MQNIVQSSVLSCLGAMETHCGRDPCPQGVGIVREPGCVTNQHTELDMMNAINGQIMTL